LVGPVEDAEVITYGADTTGLEVYPPIPVHALMVSDAVTVMGVVYRDAVVGVDPSVV
jgi:hypothetical protein